MSFQTEHFCRAMDPFGHPVVEHFEPLYGISRASELIHFSGALPYTYGNPEAETERRLSPWKQIA